MKIRLYYLIVALLPALLMACSNSAMYNKSETFDASWNMYDTVGFDVSVDDTLSPYRFFINIRNNNEYPYSNLYVFMHTVFPDGQMAHDTLEFILADRTGKWIGKGGGSVKENDILLKRNLLFPQSGQYSFSFEQAMRQEDLEGIVSLGIRIEKDTE